MTMTQLLATLSWISTFALAWMMLMRSVKLDGTTWFFFIFFVVIAIFATLIYAGQKTSQK